MRVDADAAGLAARRRALAPHPWTWLRQVHGAEVVVVRRPGEHAGVPADASVTATPGAVLAIQTADCAPVLLADDGAGVVGAVHVGWRGLMAGVVDRALEAMAHLGASRVRAVLGPCIRAGCYEFGGDDLERVAATLGPHVRATTAWGTPALDLAGGVRATLAAAGVAPVEEVGGCTACDPARWYSHRARGERERMASVVWLAP